MRCVYERGLTVRKHDFRYICQVLDEVKLIHYNVDLGILKACELTYDVISMFNFVV